MILDYLVESLFDLLVKLSICWAIIEYKAYFWRLARIVNIIKCLQTSFEIGWIFKIQYYSFSLCKDL